MQPDSQYQAPYVMSAPTEGYNDYAAGGKKRWPLIVLASLVIIGLLGFAGWKIFFSGSAAADQPMAEVQITAEGIRPTTVKVKKGQDVMWTNADSQAHQVFADQTLAPGLDSQEPLAEGDAYIYTFDKAGTVNYYDPLNPTAYKGTIIVE